MSRHVTTQTVRITVDGEERLCVPVETEVLVCNCCGASVTMQINVDAGLYRRGDVYTAQGQQYPTGWMIGWIRAEVGPSADFTLCPSCQLLVESGAVSTPDEESQSNAALAALDEIAKAFGCVEWDYPGQLVRDARSFTERASQLSAHIDECPVGWIGDRPVRLKKADDAQVLAWLERLLELRYALVPTEKE